MSARARSLALSVFYIVTSTVSFFLRVFFPPPVIRDSRVSSFHVSPRSEMQDRFAAISFAAGARL